MKKILVLCAVIVLASGLALAKGHLPEERGKKLFNDPVFAGGSKSCNTCHPDGKGLQNAGTKTNFNPEARTLEEMVNFCIRNANGGKPIHVDSGQMKDIVSYIKSVGANKPPVRSAPPAKGLK